MHAPEILATEIFTGEISTTETSTAEMSATEFPLLLVIVIKYYTANILTAKSTGFTCVPFSPVLPLSFWQPTNVGNERLYFDCSPIFTLISATFQLPS